MSLHHNNIHGYPPRNMFILKQWNFLFYLFSPNDVAFLPAPFISTSCLWNEVAVCYYFGNRLPVIKSILLVWLQSKVEGCCKATVLHELVYSRWMTLPVLSLSVTACLVTVCHCELSSHSSTVSLPSRCLWPVVIAVHSWDCSVIYDEQIRACFASIFNLWGVTGGWPILISLAQG